MYPITENVYGDTDDPLHIVTPGSEESEYSVSDYEPDDTDQDSDGAPVNDLSMSHGRDVRFSASSEAVEGDESNSNAQKSGYTERKLKPRKRKYRYTNRHRRPSGVSKMRKGWSSDPYELQKTQV